MYNKNANNVYVLHTSPACLAIVFTCSGSLEPNIAVNTAASTFYTKRFLIKKEKFCAK